MKKKSKVVIAASLLAIVGVGGITITTTTALFTRSQTSTVHISSGSLDVKFYMTSLKYDKLTAGGDVEEYTVDFKTDETYKEYYVEGKGVDLAKYTAAIFNITEAFPGMGGKFTYMIENKSKVAINGNITNTVTGKFSSGTAMTEAELAKFAVTCDWGTAEKKIAANASENANLTFKFDESADSTYENCTFNIDSLLTATQYVAPQA